MDGHWKGNPKPHAISLNKLFVIKRKYALVGLIVRLTVQVGLLKQW